MIPLLPALVIGGILLLWLLMVLAIKNDEDKIMEFEQWMQGRKEGE